MRWVICGEQQEYHVVESLVDALRSDGDEVVWIESLLPNIGPLRLDTERDERWMRRVEQAMPADVLFVVRPDEVPPNVVALARARGALAVVWLSDDPVLYDVCTRHVIDSYDLTLHTGREDVLAFYEDRHGIKGYSFPWWTGDAHYPYSYDPDTADVELGFIGSLGGPRRRWRYELLASLPFRVRFYGGQARRADDYAELGAGFVPHADLPRVLRRFRIGLNIPQRFTDDDSHPYLFPELPAFGEFFFPSRIVTYAATGLPCITLQMTGSPPPVASAVAVGSRAELVARVEELLGDRGALMDLSRATRAEYEACLSASSRLRMLRMLITGPRDHDRRERAEMWRMGSRSPRAASTESLPPVVGAVPPAVAITRVLIFGRGSSATRGFASGGQTIGHDVVVIDVTMSGSPAAPHAGTPAIVHLEFADRMIDRARPDAVMFTDGCVPSAALATGLARRRIPRIGVLIGPGWAGPPPVDRLPVVVTDDRLAEACRAVGARVIDVPAASSFEPTSQTPARGVFIHGEGSPLERTVRSRLRALCEVTTVLPAAVELILPGQPDISTRVLEGVARGAVVIASADDQVQLEGMLLPYRDAAELVALAAYYVARDDEREEIASSAHARGARDHAWPARWVQILQDLSPASPRHRPRVAIFGYHGRDNLGDDQIMTVLADALDARVEVIGYDVQGIAGSHGLPGTYALHRDDVAGVIRRADLLIVGGGGILQPVPRGVDIESLSDDPAQGGMTAVVARCVDDARAHGLGSVLLAVGVDPQGSDVGRTLVRSIAEAAAMVSVRDAASITALRACGYDGDVLLAADLAVLTEPPDPRPAKEWLRAHDVERAVVVSLRSSPHLPKDINARVAAFLDEATRSSGARIVFVAAQRGDGPRSDAAVGREVAALMEEGALHADDPSLCLPLLASAEIVVGMRLHASILANASGVPSLAIAYDHKVRAYYEEIGRAGDAFDPAFDPRSAADRAEAILCDRAVHVGDLSVAMATLRARARVAIEAAVAHLG